MRWIFLCAGRSPGEGQDARMIEAARQLHTLRPELGFLFLGEWEGLGSSPRIERLPWPSEEEWLNLLRGAALVVCHHDPGLIARAAAARVPICALGEGAVFLAHRANFRADMELHALSLAGVVEAVHGPVHPSVLMERWESLLDLAAEDLC